MVQENLKCFNYRVTIKPRRNVSPGDLEWQIQGAIQAGPLNTAAPRPEDKTLTGYYIDLPSAHIAQYVKWLKRLPGVKGVSYEAVDWIPRRGWRPRRR